jgi:hypothetical protein
LISILNNNNILLKQAAPDTFKLDVGNFENSTSGQTAGGAKSSSSAFTNEFVAILAKKAAQNNSKIFTFAEIKALFEVSS